MALHTLQVPGRGDGAAAAWVASDPDVILSGGDPLTPSTPETVMFSGLDGVIGVAGESWTGGSSSVVSGYTTQSPGAELSSTGNNCTL